MVKKLFIDTNTIIHYFLLSTIEKTKKTPKEKAELWKEYEKIKPSYNLMCKILNNNYKNTRFITSPLAFSEIFYAIQEEYICRKMFKDGIPLSSWGKLRRYFGKLTEEDIKELYKDINKLRRLIKKKIKIVSEIYVFEFIERLVFRFGLRTHDAVLFSTARYKSCSHFVTKDRDFLKNSQLKKYKQLKIISPENAISILK